MSNSSINDVMRGMINKIRETARSDVFQSLIENLKKVENNFSNTRSIPVSQAEDALTYFEQQNQNLVLENHAVDTMDDDDEIVFQEKKKSSIKKSRNEKPASRNAGLFFSKNGISNDGNNATDRFVKHNSGYVMKDGYDIGETSDQLEIMENFFERTLSLSLSEIPSEIKPDLRTPTSIQQQIARNEKLLEKILNTSSVTKAECIPAENSNQTSSELSGVDLPPIRLKSTKTTLFQSQVVSEKLGKSEVQQQLLLHTEELNGSTTQPPISSVTEKSVIDMFYKNFVKKQNQLMSGIDAALVHNFSDVFWTEIKVPFSPYWICVSDIGVFCGVEKLEIWRSLTKLPPLQWIKESYRSLRMSISQSGNIWWKLDFGVAYAYVVAANNSVEWHMTTRNVESIAVNETSAWYLCDGLVYVQNGLTHTKPFNENPVEIDCICKMSKLACFDNNLWALSTSGSIWNRENITEDNPQGSNWRKIFKPDSIIITNIALTCRKIGWIIDKFNNIYFCDNYNSNKADWWQVIIRHHNYIIGASSSNYFSKSIHHVRDKLTVIGSDRSSIWISSGVDNSIYVNKTAVLGHRWIPLSIEELTSGLKWKLLAAACGAECADGIWCLSNNNHLYFYQSSMNNIRAVEAPTTNNTVYLTATSNLLWVLTDSGDVFIRKGISEQTLSGTSWEQFHLKHKENTTFFKQLSLGTDIIWALNSNDEVYAVVCNPVLINSDSELDWTLIENSENSKITFIDIVVSPNKYMVWALDSKHNIFVREGIFDEVPFGTSWVYVPGIQAVELTISSFTVWVLTADGFIYRRCGISCQNYIGDYWVQIPGSLSLITASHSENVWGVCRTSGQLRKYTNYILNLNETFIRSRQYSENLDDEWEIIESVCTHDIFIDKENSK